MELDSNGVPHFTCDELGNCTPNQKWILSQLAVHGLEVCCKSPALSKRLCPSVLEAAKIPFIVDPPAEAAEPEPTEPGT